MGYRRSDDLHRAHALLRAALNFREFLFRNCLENAPEDTLPCLGGTKCLDPGSIVSTWRLLKSRFGINSNFPDSFSTHSGECDKQGARRYWSSLH
jgi:hypothetical protein